MKPASRVLDMDLSPIRKFAEQAGPDAIPLGVGEPTWPLPSPAIVTLNRFSGVCRYGPGGGILALREAVGAFYSVSADEVMISSGSQGALFSLIQAWLNSGDRVLLPDPGFVTYRLLVHYAGAVPVYYRLAPENHFRLTASSVLALLAQTNARAIIINHPANPTGAGADRDVIAEIAEECRRREILLISDEVYRDLYLQNRPVSLRDVSDYGIVVSSVSKAWGAPGLRVGWAVGAAEWLEPARRVHAYAATSAAYPNQLAALGLVQYSNDVHSAARAELAARWAAASRGLMEHLGINAVAPDGSFYYWLRLPSFARDDVAFCSQLRDEVHVVMIPGSVFGDAGRGYARLSFAATPEQISEGLSRIAPYYRPDSA